MGKTISLSMSSDDQIHFCTKYHCTTDQIGRVIKASILDQKHSPYWRNMEGDVSAERMIERIKRSEQFETSEETKEILHSIFREYAGTLGAILSEDEILRSKVLREQ